MEGKLRSERLRGQETSDSKETRKPNTITKKGGRKHSEKAFDKTRRDETGYTDIDVYYGIRKKKTRRDKELDQTRGQWVGGSVGRSVGRWVGRSVGRSVGWWVGLGRGRLKKRKKRRNNNSNSQTNKNLKRADIFLKTSPIDQ